MEAGGHCRKPQPRPSPTLARRVSCPALIRGGAARSNRGKGDSLVSRWCCTGCAFDPASIFRCWRATGGCRDSLCGRDAIAVPAPVATAAWGAPQLHAIRSRVDHQSGEHCLPSLHGGSCQHHARCTRQQTVRHELQATAGVSVAAGAHQSTAVDWQPQQTRPKRVALAMRGLSSLAPNDQRVDTDMLQSQRFSLAAGVEQQLRLVGRSAGSGGQACQMVLTVSVTCTANAGEPTSDPCSRDSS